ncbi:TonB-dependent receptor domain-containing protein [Marinomonas algarum]|uniref:TonB-dependent receptor n=1 Tax=Marinomonas algarum TaxID=2883105 RepID=A0A9X1LEL9_9GAMM|nr:TonB-dependent receptor [Marinomonas algarum]MCB5161696.1 TonB-dependent receptor [Marinomonas algarum]
MTIYIRSKDTNTSSLRAFSLKTLLISCSALPAMSVNAESDSSSTDMTLQPLVVTATSTPIKVADSLSSVTVITKEEIEAQQAYEMSELLAGQPGVDVSSNGGYGKTTSVYMRGANSSSTKFLIDGIPLYSATSGGAAFQYIPTSLIDRLEIVRGPKATLYGADAVGGVIQAFLPEANDESHADISVGAGSFNTMSADVTASGFYESSQYLLSVGKFDTDGDIVKEGEGAQGYNNENILLNLGHDFDSGARVTGLVMNSEGRNYYVGNENDYKVQVLGLGLSLPMTDYWSTDIKLSQSRDESMTISSGDVFDTKTQTARLSNIISAGNHEFVLGAEASEDSVEVSAYDAPNRNNKAIFAQSLFDFGQTSLQLNLRHDDNSAYGHSTTGGVALGYQLDQEHTLRTSYGRAFEAPTFNDLYYPYSGDPTLQATDSETVEIGIRGDYESFYWDAAIFDASYGDMVIWSNYTGTWVPYNVDAKAQGVELASGMTFNDWQLRAAYTWLDITDESTGYQLPKRAKRTARLGIDRSFEKGQVGVTLIAANDRTSTLGSSETLPRYVVTNVHASYEFMDDWKAEITMKNALDKEYQTANGYYGPSRSVFLTLNYSAF